MAEGSSQELALKALRRRQKRVMVGLLLTLLGVLGLGAVLPVAPSALLRAAPFAALALVGLWVGGILLGSRGSSGARRSGRQ